MLKWVVAVLLLLAGGGLPAFAERAAPEISGAGVHKDTYPPRVVSFADGVRGFAAIPYWAARGFRPLTLDLYLPPQTVPRGAGGLPLVVFIHGGAWVTGTSRGNRPFVDFPGVLAALAARGYAVASINYRFVNEARYPAQIQDVKSALRFLRRHADTYGIDAARTVVWGTSAGGFLAAMAGVSCGVAALAPPLKAGDGQGPDTAQAACVQGVVAWYGVFDMETLADQARSVGALSRDKAWAPEWALLGCFKAGCSPEQIRLASPVSLVTPQTPPMLLIAGDADKIVPVQQTTEMAARLKEAKVRHEMIVMPGIRHSLLGNTPQATREANLKALAATLRFIDETIGNGAGKVGNVTEK
ncbi:MAG TPA: alpha/beta fold hydrolase [Rhizomicrobium sp.]|nr:alpha/beta fold hydrolase [Rhizomicrobium sp.]